MQCTPVKGFVEIFALFVDQQYYIISLSHGIPSNFIYLFIKPVSSPIFSCFEHQLGEKFTIAQLWIFISLHLFVLHIANHQFYVSVSCVLLFFLTHYQFQVFIVLKILLPQKQIQELSLPQVTPLQHDSIPIGSEDVQHSLFEGTNGQQSRRPPKPDNNQFPFGLLWISHFLTPQGMSPLPSYFPMTTEIVKVVIEHLYPALFLFTHLSSIWKMPYLSRMWDARIGSVNCKSEDEDENKINPIESGKDEAASIYTNCTCNLSFWVSAFVLCQEACLSHYKRPPFQSFVSACNFPYLGSFLVLEINHSSLVWNYYKVLVSVRISVKFIPPVSLYLADSLVIPPYPPPKNTSILSGSRLEN
ncbi:hypothetical protein VP01_556g1 [Puccinia sorghi]|uniref:Uncharacterized protein n=1 Tax=Puccinia sorghi TaxID=27349 RepID=A0A0L6UJ47_9BASI|nr:hypothetical protein VP01_556g1 [Puccinia sorghi]